MDSFVYFKAKVLGKGLTFFQSRFGLCPSAEEKFLFEEILPGFISVELIKISDSSR